MIFFTSDQHFGHENILKFCARPFDSIELMDAVLIANINAYVGAEDTLYVIGDFTYRARFSEATYRNQILCKNVCLVLGNHDAHTKRGKPRQHLYDVFTAVDRVLTVNYDHRRVVMHHYPMVTWSGRGKGVYHAYGHVHGRTSQRITGLCADVGVDSVAHSEALGHTGRSSQYRPVSLPEFIEMCEHTNLKSP